MARRFAEVWEFNRNAAFAGNPVEQSRVRAWFDLNLTFGSPLHRVMQAVDRKANSMGWSFYTFNFVDDPLRNPWASATRVQVTFRSDPSNVMPQEWWDYVIPHELGHVVGWNLLNPVDKSEEWADDFRLWLLVGSPLSSPVAQRLGIWEAE